MKHAFRSLAKSPGFTCVALLTLALGIGASVTMFSFVNHYLLRPLPYAEADRLTLLRPANKSFGPMSVSYSNFKDWQERSRAFEAIAVFRSQQNDLTGVDRAERLRTIEASANLLPMLGVRPLLGSLFNPEDDRGDAPRKVLLTFNRWQRSFAGNPDIVGQVVQLDGQPYTIVGVLPDGFQFLPLQPDTADLWTPIGLHERTPNFLQRWNHSDLLAVGRLKPGSTLEQARADMQRIASELQAEYTGAGGDETIVVDDFRELITRDLRPGLLVLMAAVGCVLSIVCVNLAGLCLVRGAGREHEFSVRAALGASRRNILRQLLSENLLLAVAGGTLGLLFAQWGTYLLHAVIDGTGTPPAVISDRNVAWFIVAVTAGTTLLVGLLPALQISRVADGATLRVGVRTATAGRRQQRVRHALVVAEFALALIVLSGAALLVRSYERYLAADPGYTPGGALVMQLSLRSGNYDTSQKRLNFYHELLEMVRSLPGVRQASLSSNLLGGSQTSYVIEGRPQPERGKAPYTERTSITPDFLAAMGMRLLAGRSFAPQDIEHATPVALVDERFAQRAWPNDNPVGKRFQFGDSPKADGRWHEVVGVVSHVKSYGIDRDSREHVYLSADQETFDQPTLVLRSDGDPSLLAEPVQRAIREIDSALATSGVRPLQAVFDRQSFQRWFLTSLFAGFAIAAALLAALGIYGVTAYSVGQRMREFGIRAALGASARDVALLVVRQALLLVALGSLFGVAGALAVNRFLKNLVFGIGALDPISLLLAPAALLGVALLACWPPARRATKVDPLTALRAE